MADENKTTPETETPEVKETAKPEKEKKEKKTKKDAELEKVKAELESKNDLLLRTAAEFDNFKKRTERERAGVAEYAKAINDAVDNLEYLPADYTKVNEAIAES